MIDLDESPPIAAGEGAKEEDSNSPSKKQRTDPYLADNPHFGVTEICIPGVYREDGQGGGREGAGHWH